MHRNTSASVSVLIIDPQVVRLGRLGRSAGSVPAISVLGCERSLARSYNLTECEQPDLVIVALEQAKLPEFPMYAAMLEILQVNCLILAENPAEIRHAGLRYDAVLEAEIDQAGGLGPYLAKLYRLTAPVPAPPAPARAKRAPVDPVRPRPARAPRDPGPGGAEAWRIVVIGASTGGIEALLEVLSHFPADCPPTLIVQHISAAFLPGLVQRLDRHCAARVTQAEDSGEIRAGQVLVAPGNTQHLTLVAPGRRYRLEPGDPVSGHRPSVDALFHSAARLGPEVVGAILTGMGRDGAEGLAAIRQAGGTTIGQTAATCTVYGMPRAAFELGAVERQLDLDRIGPAILKAAARTVKEPAHARR